MMLLTATFEPASCWAMLPQKFSAATTWNAGAVELEPELEVGLDPDPHATVPPAMSASTAASSSSRGRTGRDTVPLLVEGRDTDPAILPDTKTQSYFYQ